MVRYACLPTSAQLSLSSRPASETPPATQPSPCDTHDPLDGAAPPPDMFQRTLENFTGLHLSPLQTPASGDVACTRRVGRWPGGLLHDTYGGNVRLTKIRLGEGASGEVVVCFNERTRHLMAAKKSRTQAFAIDVSHEAQAYIGGKSALAPYAILRGPKKTYMLQALCAGSVQSVVDKLGPDDRGQARMGLALIAARQILAALDVLHSQGWGHRDIKPANLLFINDSIVLADYDRVAPRDVAHLMPTLWYAPPESFGLLPAADLLNVDVWSVGASLLEIAGSCDERLLPYRQEITDHVTQILKRGELLRDGPFEACYASCTSPENQDYESEDKLTQVIMLRALVYIHEQLRRGASKAQNIADLSESSPRVHADKPWLLSPPDDPMRLIPTALRHSVQACYADIICEMPQALRDIVLSMLEPEPQSRPDVQSLRKRLNGKALDTVCDIEQGRDLLRNMSARAAQKLQARVRPEVSPSVTKRITRMFTR